MSKRAFPFDAGTGFGQLPLVVFFGIPETLFFEMSAALVEAGCKPVVANSLERVSEMIADPAFRVGVVIDRGIKDPLGLVEVGRRVSRAKWILVSEDQSVSFRTRALGVAKVEALFEYPLVPARVVAKIRQLSALYQAETPLSSVAKPAPVFKVFDPREGAVESLKSLGIDVLPRGTDVGTRRSWPKFSEDLYRRAAGSSVALQSLLDEALLNVVRDFKQLSRLSVVTFGVDSPFFEGVPENFQVISSTEKIPRESKFQSVKTAQYPELIEALRAGQPILARDVRDSPLFSPFQDQLEKVGTRSLAAIPLYLGSRPFGVIKARLRDVNTNNSLNILADLNTYSVDLSRFAMQSAFFHRIYRGHYENRNRR